MKNSKNILYSKMGVTPLDMQYGGGLDDAYMTFRDRRRRSAFADPNATSAFADPNNPSAFIPDRFPVSSNKGGGLPMLYRDNGGPTIPKERMINDQPHQLSYINDREAGLLQALGGSGRRVNGIPTYDTTYDGQYGSITEDFYSDDSSSGAADVSDAATADDSPAPSISYDDASKYITDERYSELYGKSGSTTPSFEKDEDGNYVFAYRELGVDQGKSFDENLKEVQEFGITRKETPYYNKYAFKYGIDVADKMIASARSTPGASRAMIEAHDEGYSFGGAEGTLKALLEKASLEPEEGLQNLIKKRLEKEEEEKEPVKENIIDDLGLRPVVNTIEKGFSILGFGGKDLTSQDLEAMVGQAASRGDSFTPRSDLDKNIGTAISYILPGAGFIPQSVGVYRTKNGLEFDVSKDGSLSLNMPTPNIDYGPDTTVIEDKPVEEKKKKKKEEEKSYMKDYFSGLGGIPSTKKIKNYYLKQTLKQAYPEKSEEEIDLMLINQP